MRKSLMVMMLTLGLVGWVGVQQVTAQGRNSRTGVTQQGDVTILTVPSVQAQASASGIDYTNAQPMPLPSAPSRSGSGLLDPLNAQVSLGTPSYSAGSQGDGIMSPVLLGKPAAGNSNDVTPQEFGTFNHPFSTSQIDLGGLATNTAYPYRAAGKLFFQKTVGGGTWVCSAALIKRGIVVTAAHCVANYGASQFYTNWHFDPGYRNGIAPYGDWTAAQVWIKTRYYNGTDACAVYGVVCPDDVAIIVLASQSGAYPGTSTGWFAYGANGWGFTALNAAPPGPIGPQVTQITQLGYPVCLDNGQYQERNDSYGYVDANSSNNTVIGSLMCGGSSGGPWVVNLGKPPVLTGTTAGTYPDHNVIVGVTSWGYVSTLPKEHGASPFTSYNVVSLVNSACTSVPAAC